MSEDSNAAVLVRIAGEVGVMASQVAAVARLLGEGNTIPFIARYRKEAHGNLDEVQILKIQERVAYYTELEDRRAVILKSIEEQGKLTDELRGKIERCMVKSALEDLYQPYRPKRRTRAMIAKERGLEPLADIIWVQGSESPDAAAAPFVDAAKDVPDAAAALAPAACDGAGPLDAVGEHEDAAVADAEDRNVPGAGDVMAGEVERDGVRDHKGRSVVGRGDNGTRKLDLPSCVKLGLQQIPSKFADLLQAQLAIVPSLH